jgi:hypothetical protein
MFFFKVKWYQKSKILELKFKSDFYKIFLLIPYEISCMLF